MTVQFSAVPTASSGTPTGNVTVSDGTISSTGTVAMGQCSLTVYDKSGVLYKSVPTSLLPGGNVIIHSK